MRAPDAVQEHIWQKVHLRPEASVPRQPFHPVSPTSLPDEAVHEPPSFGGRFVQQPSLGVFHNSSFGILQGLSIHVQKA